MERLKNILQVAIMVFILIFMVLFAVDKYNDIRKENRIINRLSVECNSYIYSHRKTIHSDSVLMSIIQLFNTSPTGGINIPNEIKVKAIYQCADDYHKSLHNDNDKE